MEKRKSLLLRLTFGLLCGLVFISSTFAQNSSDAIHEIEVYLRARGGQPGGVHIRLVRQSRMLPIAETFSGQEGEVKFRNLLPGDYIVETIESERFEATTTKVSIIVPPTERGGPRPTSATVTIDLPARKPTAAASPGVVMADVDLNVPEAALKHYRKGSESLRSGNHAEAVKEFKAALEVYPHYYAARLELGRELRSEKLFTEAEKALKPLGEIGPRHAEPHIEYGMVLLALRRQKEAARELRKALELEEANWVTNLYLGWSLLEGAPDEAARYFTRALELNEQRAAQAHLSLARLAHAKGNRTEAIRHLEAYLRLVPDAPDAAAVRKLLNQLRK